MILQRAHLSQLCVLMSWFPDEASARMWGGPAIRFPFFEQTFLEDIRWGEIPSYVLQAGGTLLAFGQIYIRENRVHLSRLAVTPSRRGEGIGGTLIEALIAQGKETFPGCVGNSLYVLGANNRAVRCYERAGFAPAPPPAADRLPPEQLFMVRQSS